jgi:LPXTG-motif cell wall-anchored protein
MGASSGATSAGESSAADENSATDNNVASDEMAENGASAASGSNSAASQQSTLPTTGAPLAGLLGLAVLAVGAGVFLRLRSKRDDEGQPEES